MLSSGTPGGVQLPMFSEAGAVVAEVPQVDDGRAGAREGMERARAHAENDVPGWGQMATGYLVRYIAEVRPALFISPAVRKWAESQGLEKPPHLRAWGAVFSRARRAGLIVPAGFVEYGDEEMHAQSVRQWRAA